MGIGGLLFGMGIAFVLFKLFGLIDWKWRWVLFPFFVLAGILLVSILLIVGEVGLVDWWLGNSHF